MSAGRLGSISARLVLMLALVAVVVFSAAGFLLHKALEQVLIADERADLLGKTEVVKHFIGEARSMDDLPMLRRHLAATSVGGRFRWNVWLVGRDGALLYGAEPMPPSVQRDGDKVWLRRQDGVELRGAHFRLPDHAVFPDAQVLIGMDPRPRQQMLSTYDDAGLMVGVAGVLCTIALAWLATRRGLRALSALSREAEVIQPGALSRRLTLPEDSAGDTAGAALQRGAVADGGGLAPRLEGFNANVAHELRTPLAIMINGAEVVLSRDRPEAEMRDVLESHLEEAAWHGVDDQRHAVPRARRPGRRGGRPRRAYPLRDEALGVGEFVEILLDEKHQRLAVEGDHRMPVNRALLRRGARQSSDQCVAARAGRCDADGADRALPRRVRACAMSSSAEGMTGDAGGAKIVVINAGRSDSRGHSSAHVRPLLARRVLALEGEGTASALGLAIVRASPACIAAGCRRRPTGR